MSHTFLVSRPLRESSVWLPTLGCEAAEAGYAQFDLTERDVDHHTIECTLSERRPA